MIDALAASPAASPSALPALLAAAGGGRPSRGAGSRPRRRGGRAAAARPAVAYLRVSTDATRQGLGLEAQRAAIAAWARREGAVIVAEHVETVSGGAKLVDRPVLIAALADVAVRRASALVVAKLDRFSRDATSATLAIAELERHGATLAVADGHGDGDDPTSTLVRTLLVAVGAFERAMIAARIRAALAVKRTRGERTGGVPFGYRAEPGPERVGRDGVARPVAVLVADEAEQATIALARELRASGMTYREVEAELARRGVVGRAGTPLTLPVVHRICQAPGAAE